MTFRDRNYMITSSRTESLKGAAFLSKMLGILQGKRVASPHAELVAIVTRRLHSEPRLRVKLRFYDSYKALFAR